MMNIEEVNAYLTRANISSIGSRFADFITRLDGENNLELRLASALVCHQVEMGDISLDLGAFAGRSIEIEGVSEKSSITFPSAPEWVSALTKSEYVGQPGQRSPLILDNQHDRPRLYLLKYWKHEQTLLNYLARQVNAELLDIDPIALNSILDRLFPNSSAEIDWQRKAAETAAKYKFSVITGGPGTGKTTTVFKIIQLLADLDPQNSIPIALTAPTGKATVRLHETINRVFKADLEDRSKDRVEITAATTHRLLGVIPGTPNTRHNENRPLPYDTIILDEASMMDIALMSRLIKAIKPDARLILLGDQYQLSAVEAGSLFGDICGQESPPPETRPIQRHITKLKKSYRFDEEKGIGALSRNVNEGRSDTCLELIQSDKTNELSWLRVSTSDELLETLTERVMPEIESYLLSQTIEEAFDAFEESMLLCAVRRGPFGVETVNQIIERYLSRRRLASLTSGLYHGKPIIITRNQYDLDLFNGDIGIIFHDGGDDDKPRAFFRSAEGGFRKVSASRLTSFESAFAMTVHKSQGSEFNKARLILPNQFSPILTRELIYTAITRARKSVEIWGTSAILSRAIDTRLERSSLTHFTLWKSDVRK